MQLRQRSILLIILIAIFAVAVTYWLFKGEAKLTFKEVSFSDLDGWSEDGQKEAFEAFLKSCATLADNNARKLPENFDREAYRDSFAGACVLAEMGRGQYLQNASAAQGFFEANFTPWRLKVGWKSKGQLTGYYEPLLEASLTPDPDYPVPLHGNPGDQVTIDLGKFRESLEGTTFTGRLEGSTVVPYHTREEIVGGALADKGLEIIWVKDPINAFFLQVQGSGRARLADGSFVGVGYAGKNGHAYTSIGKVLVETGAMNLEDVSLQSIRAWLEDNPDQADILLNKNASYVFFRLLEDGDGPFGSAGAALTAERSIAVDRKYIPLGLPLWISGNAPDPDNPTGDAVPLRRLFVAQDTGGAIKGEMRADLFFGFGDRAEIMAGHMNNQGEFYLLLPNGITP